MNSFPRAYELFFHGHMSYFSRTYESFFQLIRYRSIQIIELIGLWCTPPSGSGRLHFKFHLSTLFGRGGYIRFDIGYPPNPERRRSAVQQLQPPASPHRPRRLFGGFGLLAHRWHIGPRWRRFRSSPTLSPLLRLHHQLTHLRPLLHRRSVSHLRASWPAPPPYAASACPSWRRCVPSNREVLSRARLSDGSLDGC